MATMISLLAGGSNAHYCVLQSVHTCVTCCYLLGWGLLVETSMLPRQEHSVRRLN
jgi:hypothetical protein